MDKKVIFGLLGGIAVIFLISIGVIINHQRNNYTPEARVIKKLIQGQNKYNKINDSRGYDISFTQKYHVQFGPNTEGAPNYSKDYSGEGHVQLSTLYELPVEKLTLSTAINDSKSYIKGEQKETITSTDFNRSVAYDFAAKTDQREFFIEITNNGSKTLNARIDKKELTESVTEEKLIEGFSKLLFMDAWKDTKTMIELSNKIMSSTNLTDAQSVNKIAKDHDVKVEYVEVGYKITFNLNTEGLLDQKAKIPGFMLIDKDNYSVLEYEYDLSDYYHQTIMADADKKPNLQAKVEEYKVKGQSLRQTFGDIFTPVDPIVRYHAENISDFIQQFNANIIQKEQ